MSEYIIAGEIVRIHNYLLKAPKLKYLVGGSLLIETFSTCFVPEVAKKLDGKCYTNAAGRFLVGFTRKDKAEIFQQLVRYVGISLFGEDIFLICGPFEKEEKILEKIGDELEIMKQSSGTKGYSALPGLQSMIRCEACDSWGATLQPGIDREEKTEICKHCLFKLKARNGKRGDKIKIELPANSGWGITEIIFGEGKTAKEDQVFINYAENPYHIDEKITSFKEIAEKSNPQYLGVFYADGNNMGEILYRTKNLDDHNAMSDALIAANNKALDKAVKAVSEDGAFPGLVLIKGGDDLLVALPADRAVTFSRVFLKEASDNDETPFKEGICGGLVLSKAQMPFPILYEKAEELLSSAKKQIWRLENAEKTRPRDKSAIDFMMVTSPLLDSLENMPERKMEKFEGMVKAVKTIMEGDERATVPLSGTSRNAMFTARPYLLDEYENLIEEIKIIKCTEPKLPARVFMDLKDICFPSAENLDLDGTFKGLKPFIDKMKKLYHGQAEVIENFFNFKILNYNTWIIKDEKTVRQWHGDIIEITDFVK